MWLNEHIWARTFESGFVNTICCYCAARALNAWENVNVNFVALY